MKRLTVLCVRMIVIILIGIVGCTTTKVISVWKDETFEAHYFKSVMIVGVVENQDAEDLFETVCARKFNAHDVRAVPGQSIIRDYGNFLPESLVREAAENQFDAVLMSRLNEIAVKTSFQAPINDPLIDIKGGMTRHEFYRLESKLYGTRTGKMVWSASFETVDPKSVNSAIESMTNVLMKELRAGKYFR